MGRREPGPCCELRMKMTASHPLLVPLRELHRKLRSLVLAACHERTTEELSSVADDGQGDTIFAIDKIGEELLVKELSETAAAHGGIVLVAEGISGGKLSLPLEQPEANCRYRIIVDPIDGTRGLMYQKRPAWILTGVAPNLGDATSLSDIELSVQTEIPLIKQNLCDELWAERGKGATAERLNLVNNERTPLVLRPSRATSIEQGYAMISRFFPGARDELSAIDDSIVHRLLGPSPRGKALCFEDQYPSTGGQLYELMVGHDRFVADLRPLLGDVLHSRGLPLGLCCHPYDICTALIAEELGVLVRNPLGGPINYTLDVELDVAWAGYANANLAQRIEPILKEVLLERGLANVQLGGS
jgi:fructose-1,6-bisphosphatase/inositol monophosphatase family enzyme